MLRALRLFSWLVCIAAAGVVVWLGMFWLKGDPEIEAYINCPGIVRFAPSDRPATEIDRPSQLVCESIAFSLRINPPQIITPDEPTTSQQDTVVAVNDQADKTPEDSMDVPVSILPDEKIKFKLLGTAICLNRPEKSLALIQLSDGKTQWFSAGRPLGRFRLEEIRDGRAAVIRGNEKTDLSVPPKPGSQNLLK